MNKRIKRINGFCAPLALKYLSGASDKSVYDVCLANWFQQAHGMEEHEFLKAAKELNIRLRRMNLKKSELYGAELYKFIKANPDGKFLIYTHAHLFVVNNSEVIDQINTKGYFGLRRKVTGAWRVN